MYISICLHHSSRIQWRALRINRIDVKHDRGWGPSKRHANEQRATGIISIPFCYQAQQLTVVARKPADLRDHGRYIFRDCGGIHGQRILGGVSICGP
jgi:hypothetical protein